MATFEDLVKANESIKTTDIKGKNYAEVNQRIKAFRMVYPDGSITTQMLSNNCGVCVFKASVYDNETLLGTGHAYEKEDSSYINKTSYIENCETSAVGRALAMCGFGIDVAIRSAEEEENAQLQQTEIKPINATKVKALNKMLATEGIKLETIYTLYKVNSLEEITEKQHLNIINNIKKIRETQENE